MTATLNAAAARRRAPSPSTGFQLSAKNLPVGSAEWWLARLIKKLDQRVPAMQRFEDYYDGDQPLEFATKKFRAAFGELFADFADNFAALVVDAVDERLDVEGFRFPYGLDEADPADVEDQPEPGAQDQAEPGADSELADSDDEDAADDDAWRIWQANHLDAESQMAHVDALVKGCAYIHVSPYKGDWIDDQTPLITVEDALQCYVEIEPGGRRRRRAAIRRWIDDSGLLFANVYLPDGLYKFQTVAKVVDDDGKAKSASQTKESWVPRQDPLFDDNGKAVLAGDGSGAQADEPWPLPNPAGVVPIIPLRNRARLGKEGKSELQEVLPVQDAINKACSDMLIASEFAGFGQKYVTNFRLKIDPNTGQPVQPFQIGVDRVLVAAPPEDGDPETKFGEFSATPLDGFVMEIAMMVQHLSSITRTPPHYFLANMGNFPSGDALRAAEAGLVTKAKRRQTPFGEAWEEALRLAFSLIQDPRGQSVISETIWRDPETRTEAEHVDAQIKQKALSVPLQQIWKNLGYTPTQIGRFRKMLEEEAAWGLGMAPAQPGVNPGPPTDPTGAAIAAGVPPTDPPQPAPNPAPPR